MNSVVFLDMRKAFDTVNNQILLDKLHCYGIGDGELLFFRSYLQNRTQCCSVSGQISTLQTVTCGVPHGSILGPLLFIIYMNDLPAFVQEANITMYADDTSLHKVFRTLYELNEEIIPAFSRVCKWLRNNKLIHTYTYITHIAHVVRHNTHYFYRVDAETTIQYIQCKLYAYSLYMLRQGSC